MNNFIFGYITLYHITYKLANLQINIIIYNLMYKSYTAYYYKVISVSSPIEETANQVICHQVAPPSINPAMLSLCSWPPQRPGPCTTGRSHKVASPEWSSSRFYMRCVKLLDGGGFATNCVLLKCHRHQSLLMSRRYGNLWRISCESLAQPIQKMWSVAAVASH